MGRLQKFMEGCRLTPEEQKRKQLDEESMELGYSRNRQRHSEEKIPEGLALLVRGFRYMLQDKLHQ